MRMFYAGQKNRTLATSNQMDHETENRECYRQSLDASEECKLIVAT